MTQKTILVTGSLSGFLCVALGAFGAHGLRELLTAYGRTDTFELAVQYHFYHSIALLVTGLVMSIRDSPWLPRAGWCFVAGIVFFSGSLYVLAAFNLPALGAVTPVGGILFLTGWVFLTTASSGGSRH